MPKSQFPADKNACGFIRLRTRMRWLMDMGSSGDEAVCVYHYKKLEENKRLLYLEQFC
ncbi:MAG TPA: hypothetical protein H9924_09280 [Candidatus Phocaeicola merdavium]|nr:hypothetical protein [Candidatus Phocaeicola merdavium]